MASYNVEIKKSALKDIEKLDNAVIPRLWRRIEGLKNNPKPVDSKKLTSSEKSYRIRVNDYRIIYQIDEKIKLVTVFAVGHRKDIYR